MLLWFRTPQEVHGSGLGLAVGKDTTVAEIVVLLTAVEAEGVEPTILVIAVVETAGLELGVPLVETAVEEVPLGGHQFID